jgi:tetratricopeptide (TPR) repeat protein
LDEQSQPALLGDRAASPGDAARGTLSGDLDVARGTLSGGTDAATDAPPAAGPRAPDLDVARELARGGMGIIWLATQRSLERPVAVKTLRPELARAASIEKFEAEALVTGRLEHPNIPPVHAYGRDVAGEPYLCMKLVKGTAWARLLAPETAEERERAAKVDRRGHLEILRRVAEAIAYAHSCGVIHRDLKPENVMVGEFGEVLVMDWGIALDLAKPRAPRPAGVLADPVGTPAYMAPEMARCEDDRIGPATDVYLLGGLLYEILTGAPPHAGEGLAQVLLAAAAGDILPPARRSPERKPPEALAEIALRALDPDPTRRYPSAADFSRAIDEYLRNEASLTLSATALVELAALEAKIATSTAIPAEVYGPLAACLGDLAQAVKLWSGNRAAQDGLRRGRLVHAEFAIREGDLGVAEAELAALPADDARVLALRAEIASARAARRRVRGLVGLLALGVLLAGTLVFRQTGRAEKAEAARARRAAATGICERILMSSPAERIETYKRALAVDPSWPEGWTGLARSYHMRAYDAHLGEDPQAATADLALAVAPFDRAVALEPSNPTLLLDRGYIHEMRGDRDSALADYRRAILVAPGSNAAFKSATEIAIAERRFEDAVALATGAIEDRAADMDYFRRGLARFVLGDLAGARADADCCLALYPRDEWYLTLKTLVLLALGDDGEAAGEMVLALRAHSHAPHLLPLAAYLAARHGDLERAQAIAARAREERDERARCYLAFEPLFAAARFAKPPHERLGRALNLEEDLAGLVPADVPAPLARRRRGEDRFRRGEVELAFADAARTLDEDPADGAARFLRARCHVALGEPEVVRADLRIAEALAPNLAKEIEALRAELGKRR